jgi:YggT family protein
VGPFRARLDLCQGIAGSGRGIAAARESRPPLVRAPASRYTMAFRFERFRTPAMRALLYVILMVLNLYIWLLIAAAVLSWLVAFNVVNVRNQFVAMIGDFLYRITEPVLRPIRNMMPNLGGLDISPVILILIIIFIQKVIEEYIYPNVF